MTTKQGLSDEEKAKLDEVCYAPAGCDADFGEICSIVDAIAEARAAVARELLRDHHMDPSTDKCLACGDWQCEPSCPIAAELARLKP